VSHHSPAIPAPERSLRVPPVTEKNACPCWSNGVEVVIGVDTTSKAHTAAVLDNPDGAGPSPMTGTADPDGYAGLLTPR
jgi:hypothetical protein